MRLPSVRSGLVALKCRIGKAARAERRQDAGPPADPFGSMDSMMRAVYELPDGSTVEIPYDDDGYVPMWVLAQRFQAVGDFDSDVGVGGVPVRRGPFTPDDIVDWWIDPSVCDLAGLDSEDTEVYDVSSLPPEQRTVQRRIAVVAPKEEADRIRRVLAESFTVAEIEAMSRHGSFVIYTVADGGEASGCYWRRQDGIDVPIISLEEGCTPDAMVHELVHHSRAVDPTRHGILRTSYPTDETGRMDSGFVRCLSEGELASILETEERLTVAETDVRTDLDRSQSGYYDGVRGMDPREAYRQDRRILTDTPPDVPDQAIPRLVGRQARQAVLRNYAYSNIAEAQILSRNVRKR